MDAGGTLRRRRRARLEPEDVWTDRMDAAKWGDWIPRKVLEDEVYETIYVGGEIRGGGRELTDQMAAAVGMTAAEFYDLTAPLRVPGGNEPDARIEALDVDHVDAAVLYPSMALFFGPNDPIPALHDLDFVTDCIRAYNDWIADFCAAHPKRLFGVAGAPLQDVDRAVAETRRACGELGLRGRVRPSVGVRRRAPAQPLRVRPVLGRVPGAGRAGRVPPRRARRHPRRVREVPARRWSRRTRRSPTWR